MMSASKGILLHAIAGVIGAASMLPASAAPCEEPVHWAFDFWLGEWEVRTPDGKLAGDNRIEREYGGCVLHERYTTGKGYSGESLNIQPKDLASDLGRHRRNAAAARRRSARRQDGARGANRQRRWASHKAPHHLVKQPGWQRSPTVGVN
jgi:hypothetical protein